MRSSLTASDARAPAPTAVSRLRLLPHLLDEVVAARRRERSQLRGPGARADGDLVTVRMNTLRALLEYEDAIKSLAWPVPRRIQMEIRLLRALCDPTAARPLEAR